MKHLYIISLFSLLLCSCDKFLDIQPTGMVIAQTSEEYRAMLTNVYSKFPADRSLTTMRTEEMTLDPQTTAAEDINSFFEIWTWKDVAQDENTTSFSWRTFYHTIYLANYILEHQAEITQGSADEVRQIVGEAYMLRAYSHFLLVNLFGEPYTKCNPATTPAVPLSTKADIEVVLARNTVGEVYDQIVADLLKAKTCLNVKEWEADLSYRFNTVSADAILSRVYLYMGKWDEALKAAESVIKERPELENLVANTFTMPDNYKSREAIVCLEHVMRSAYKKAGAPNTEYINTFRTGDLRKSRFFKAETSRLYVLQKGGTQQTRSTFRTAEAYLTAAECAARMGDKAKAVSLLTPLIQNRYMAALQPTVISELEAMDGEALIAAILNERNHELCYEGHRWFDLRRTTQPAITKQFGDKTYTLSENDSRYTMPIPTEAINANPGLGK